MIVDCPPIVSIGCSLAGGAASSVGASVAHDLLAALTRGMVGAAAWLVGHLISVVNSTAAVDLSAPWFVRREGAMITVMGLVITPLLLAATIGAIMRQDLRRLVRTWAVALPVAAVVTMAAINLTQIALGAADAMTAVISDHADLGAYGAFTKLLVVESGQPGGAPAVAAILACLVVLGAVFVWLELVVRAAAIYVAVFFLPLALAGLVWPATAHMTKRLVEGLATLILTKFVIVATLTLGAGAVASAHGVDQVAAGTAILFVAAFAPFVLFRMVPIVEAASVAHLEGLSRRPLRATSSGAARATSLAGPGAAAVHALRGAGAGVGPVAGAAVRADTVGTAAASYDPATGAPPTGPPEGGS